jgi:thioredoxin 1
MAYETTYLGAAEQPTREQVDAMTGPVLVEFGTEWCGFCQAAAPRIKQLLEQHPQVRHVRVEDGSGRKLGRSFRVKLWPNLVFLRDGTVLRQLARPDDAELQDAFRALTSA